MTIFYTLRALSSERWHYKEQAGKYFKSPSSALYVTDPFWALSLSPSLSFSFSPSLALTPFPSLSLVLPPPSQVAPFLSSLPCSSLSLTCSPFYRKKLYLKIFSKIIYGSTALLSHRTGAFSFSVPLFSPRWQQTLSLCVFYVAT